MPPPRRQGLGLGLGPAPRHARTAARHRPVHRHGRDGDRRLLPALARADAGGSPWLLAPAALALAAFAWLLTLHPSAAGRTYAADGGVYVVVALLWLWQVDGVSPTRWDVIGGAVCLAGMAIIALQPRA